MGTFLSASPGIRSKIEVACRSMPRLEAAEPKKTRKSQWTAEERRLQDTHRRAQGDMIEYLYRNLKFPDAVYEHFERYQQEKESSS